MVPKNECLDCEYRGTKDDIDCALYCWYDANDPKYVGVDYESRESDVECPLDE